MLGLPFHNNSHHKRKEVYCLRDYAWKQWAWHGVEANPLAQPWAAIQLLIHAYTHQIPYRALKLFECSVYFKDTPFRI